VEPGVTVVIPTIPVRQTLLQRAITSVLGQTRSVDALSVSIDHARRGAWDTRLRALNAVRTEWTAFLDDDDEFLPQHIERLLAGASESGADMVYSWFDTVPHGCDPFPTWFATEPWDANHPRHTTITFLVRTGLAQRIGFTAPTDVDGRFSNEDWRMILELNRLSKIHHIPERTWLWHHDSGNTSGRPDRW
jgi:glycosyltransferase involved in cell wall biosynthesis